MASETGARHGQPPARADISGRVVAPSMLAADPARFGEQVDGLLDAGARVFHFDVMDGHFVPPISFGPGVIAALSERIHARGGVVDVHLMVEHPERQIDAVVQSGADVITVHIEALTHPHYVLSQIRAAGCLAGLALNPGTGAEVVQPLADLIDVGLCMTVNPGWGGQRFIDRMRPKIARMRTLLDSDASVEVDGGIDRMTGPICAALGANLIVAGSAILGAPVPALAYAEIARGVAAADTKTAAALR